METATFQLGKVQAPEMNIPAFSGGCAGFIRQPQSLGLSR
jgi:hypothetical protein